MNEMAGCCPYCDAELEYPIPDHCPECDSNLTEDYPDGKSAYAEEDDLNW